MSRLRATLRLAARQALRAKGASTLVVALVALPIALLSAGVVYTDSRVATRDENLTAELGQTDAWIMVVGGYDPTRRQAIDDSWFWEVDRDEEWNPVNPELPPPTAPPALPADARVLTVTTTTAAVQTAEGAVTLDAWIGDATDPALAGR